MPSERIKELEFTIHGKKIRRPINLKLSLLRFLRDEMKLKGTKDGCSTGDCGSCVILVNGEPVDSCLFNMRLVDGASVETIEGLAQNGSLHPIQAAFLECGAVQCGFCIPGMIMATKALLDKNPSPAEGDIREALEDIICRCTGYIQIFEAVRQAAKWLDGSEGEFISWQPRYGSLGVSATLVDGEKCATGQLPFVDDMERPGQLYGQVVWSQYPSAKILGIDTKEAERSVGVIRVLTAKDVPGLNAHGRTNPDQPVFCYDRVRFTGDIVALVLAKSKDQAVQAAKLVKVDYKELPGVYSPQEALAEDAPKVHPDGNICERLVHQRGDIEEAFKSAACVVEREFETQRVDHAYLEPQGVLAETTSDGSVIVYTPTQAPFETQEQLVNVLDLPPDKVRVVCTPLGGGFGGKLEINVEAVAAVAAYVTRKPVKIILKREESLHSSVKRHPFSMKYRVGVDPDGTLVGVDAELIADAGPYTGNSPRVIDQACIFSCGPYRVPNVRIEGVAVFTNNANCGAFRGYGINQGAVAIEQILDELAGKVGKDPFEIRKINMLLEGDETITGQLLPDSVGAVPTLEACKSAFQEEWPDIQEMARPGYKIGYGVAAGYKNVGAGKGKVDDAGAKFTLMPDGRIELRASVVDMGQAIRTCMVQIACQTTGLDPRSIDLITGDTALTHRHRSASGERQTLIAGNAVVKAGKQFKEKLLGTVGQWMELPAVGGSAVSMLTIEGDMIKTRWSQYTEEQEVTTLAEAARRAAEEGITLEAEAVYVAPKTWPLSDAEAMKNIPKEEYRNYATYAYATQVAFVEVEEASGNVKVLKVIAAHDVGVPINPQQIRGQLIGSVIMMQGYTLTENYPMTQGRPPYRHVTFGRLGVPTSMDAPPVRIEIVEDPYMEGPFGAKGISEIATVPLPPAILNAIYNATGTRITRLPVDKSLLKDPLSAGSGT